MKYLMTNTQIAVFLSINVQINNGSHTWLASRPLFSLTWLLVYWYLVTRTVCQVDQVISKCLTKLKTHLLVLGVVFGIGYRAALYGLGANL
jgi:hypothetical protein